MKKVKYKHTKIRAIMYTEENGVFNFLNFILSSGCRQYSIIIWIWIES